MNFHPPAAPATPPPPPTYPHFLRVADIVKIAPCRKSTWWALVRAGIAPPGKLVTRGMRVWTAEEVTAVFSREHPASNAR